MPQAFAAYVEWVARGYQQFQSQISTVRRGLSDTIKDADKLNAKTSQAGASAASMGKGYQSAASGAGKALSGAGGSADELGDKTEKAGGKAGKAAGSFQGIHRALMQIERIAAVAFGAISAGVAGTLRLAAPKEWDDFSAAVQIAGVRIGTTFLPIIREATAWVTRIGNYFAHLTNAQRENILHWVKMASGVLLVTLAITRVVSMIQVLRHAVIALGTALGLTPIGAILAAIGAIVALVSIMSALNEEAETSGSIMSGLKDLWASLLDVWETIKEAGRALMPLFELIGNALIGILKGVLVAVGWIIKGIAAVIAWLKPVIDATVAGILKTWDFLVAAFEMWWEIVQEIFSAFGNLLGLTGDQAIDWKGVLSGALNSIKAVVENVFSFFQEAIRLTVKAWIALATMVERGLKFKWVGTFDEIQKRWKEFDDKIAAKQKKREDDAAAREANKKKKQEEGNRFTPEQKIQKPELTGIEDFWRKMQQTTADDPKAKVAQAQLDEQMKTNQKLDEQTELLKGNNNKNVGARQ